MAQKNKGVFWRRYKHQLNQAKCRGIPFLMTFEEWCDVWLSSGKWEERGRRRGQYVMARLGDRGAYERANIKICLVGENVAESNQNCDNPTEQRSAVMKTWWASAPREKRQAISRALSANNPSHRPEVRAKQRADAIGRRMIFRNGRRSWAYPGDADYPA
jgi:hypothetical protein